MAGKVVVDEEDKIIEFLTLILFDFLRFGDIKIPIEIENQYIVLILDETFRGVIFFLSIVEHECRAVISTGHTFEGQCTAMLWCLDSAIGGSSKDIPGFEYV